MCGGIECWDVWVPEPVVRASGIDLMWQAESYPQMSVHDGTSLKVGMRKVNDAELLFAAVTHEL